LWLRQPTEGDSPREDRTPDVARDHGGIRGACFLEEITFMKNWKTTLGGILTSLGLALKGHSDLWWLGDFCTITGPLLLGLGAKDHNVTGTPENNWKDNAAGKQP